MALLSRPGNIAVQGYSTGFSHFRLSRVGLAAGRQLGSKASLGIRVNYHLLNIAGYGATTALSADAGLTLKLSEQLHFGLQLLNPAGSDMRAGLYTPGLYSAGIGYDQSDQMYISIELIKEQSRALNAVMGMQYKPALPLSIRISVQTSEPSFVFGAGYTRSGVRIDLYSAYHLRLGVGSGIQLYWLWKNRTGRQ